MLEIREEEGKLNSIQRYFAPDWIKNVETPDYGYLYVFQTKKDIPVTIMDNILINPKAGFKLIKFAFNKLAGPGVKSILSKFFFLIKLSIMKK